jgi:hypothetical protein
LAQLVSEIQSGLLPLNEQTLADLEKKAPDLETLLDQIEKSGGAV